jgi:hypothetical protein
MDEQFCVKFDTITNYFTLINLGTGEEVYKGVNNLGQKEFKTLVKTGNLITITSDANTVIIGLDETALNTYVEANQKLTVVSNAGSSGETLVNTAIVTGDTTTYPIKRIIHSAQNGSGESVVRDLQVNPDDLTLRTKKIKSDSLTITATDTEISIEQPEVSDIPNFIVNSAYTGDESTGTLSKPFKTIEDAKTAYIGTNNAQDPEFKNANITIQKGSGYTYTGNLNFNMGSGSIILEEGASVNSNPASGDWLCDFDTLSDTEPAYISIILKDNSLITLTKNGFRNRGTTVNNGAFTDSKRIILSGNGGKIYQSTNDNTNILYTIIETNFTSGNTYKNDGNSTFNVENIELNSLTQQIYKIGGNSTMLMSNVICTSSATNSSIKVFNQIGGSIRQTNSVYETIGATPNVLFSLTKNTGIPCDLNIIDAVLSSNAITIFQNESSQQSTVTLKNIKTQFGTVTNIAKSPSVLWTNFMAQNCIFDTGVVDQTQVDLTAGNTISTTNIFAGRLVESLQIFGSRALAVTGGLQKGNAFVNRKTILAGSFVLGEEYQISALGTGVNWTSIGALSATVGTNFTYNGTTVIGVGGEAYKYSRDVLI